MTQPHAKHVKLARPHDGHFARHEWAILGTTCGNIQKLAPQIAEHLSPKYKVAYSDADHAAAGETGDNTLIFSAQHTDKIDFQRLDRRQPSPPSAWQMRMDFADADVALVNGNHFAATRQLVALDPRKFESLSRKLARLTDVQAWLALENSPAEPPDFLQTHCPNWRDLPIFRLDDAAGIAQFLAEKIAAPPLCGLVLAGGRSQRMGRDKSLLRWHGDTPQREHLAALLESLGIPAHLSCRAEQAAEFAENQRVIADSFLDLGPMGAILSAFRARPDAAWLVLACDLPLLDAPTLRCLMAARQPSAVATAFRSPGQPEGFPEPLITIWEPKAYPRLLQFLAQGTSCPRKVLLNSELHLLDAPDPAALTNVNTPEEAEKIFKKIF